MSTLVFSLSIVMEVTDCLSETDDKLDDATKSNDHNHRAV